MGFTRKLGGISLRHVWVKVILTMVVSFRGVPFFASSASLRLAVFRGSCPLKRFNAFAEITGNSGSGRYSAFWPLLSQDCNPIC